MKESFYNFLQLFLFKATYALKPLLYFYDKGLMNKYGKLDIKHQPVFIIGAPRTGSTFLYQYLTNALDITYIDNLSSLFYRNLLFGFSISNRIYKNKPHNCFSSKLGNTFRYGMHAPSECGKFWYRWIDKKQNFVDEGSVPAKGKAEIRKVIDSVINCSQKPILFKNMNMGLRLKLLKEIYPDAKIIFIRRNILDTSLSIINARKIFFGDETKWWSLKPINYSELKQLDYKEQVVKQVYYIEKQIFNDLSLFPKQNISIVAFEDFIQNPAKYIKRIMEFINYDKVRIIPRDNKTVKVSKKLNDTELKLVSDLNSVIDKLNWNDYTS